MSIQPPDDLGWQRAVSEHNLPAVAATRLQPAHTTASELSTATTIWSTTTATMAGASRTVSATVTTTATKETSSPLDCLGQCWRSTSLVYRMQRLCQYASKNTNGTGNHDQYTHVSCYPGNDSNSNAHSNRYSRCNTEAYTDTQANCNTDAKTCCESDAYTQTSANSNSLRWNQQKPLVLRFHARQSDLHTAVRILWLLQLHSNVLWFGRSKRWVYYRVPGWVF